VYIKVLYNRFILNDKSEGCGRKLLYYVLKYYPGISLEELKKIIEKI
jgi:hypothetical protein